MVTLVLYMYCYVGHVLRVCGERELQNQWSHTERHKFGANITRRPRTVNCVTQHKKQVYDVMYVIGNKLPTSVKLFLVIKHYL